MLDWQKIWQPHICVLFLLLCISTRSSAPHACNNPAELASSSSLLQRSNREAARTVLPLSRLPCTPRETPAHPKVFLVIPGLGSPDRVKHVVQRIQTLRDEVDLHCEIFIYNSSLRLEDVDLYPCSLTHRSGHYFDFVGQVEVPDGMDNVLFWLDDVIVLPRGNLSLRFRDMVEILDFNGLDLVSPTYSEDQLEGPFAAWRENSIMMQRAAEPLGRRARCIEPMMMLFTPESFTCYQSLYDGNGFGIRMEAYFTAKCSQFCKGLLDSFTMVDTGSASYDYSDAWAQADAYEEKHGHAENCWNLPPLDNSTQSLQLPPSTPY